MMSNVSITDLPDEIVELIIGQMETPVDIIRCSQVCKRFWKASQSDSTWQNAFTIARLNGPFSGQLSSQLGANEKPTIDSSYSGEWGFRAALIQMQKQITAAREKLRAKMHEQEESKDIFKWRTINDVWLTGAMPLICGLLLVAWGMMIPAKLDGLITFAWYKTDTLHLVIIIVDRSAAIIGRRCLHLCGPCLLWSHSAVYELYVSFLLIQ
eukprot:TRINITY_DN4077_c0_g1_i3.p1 TRINITY_DN4077_c0_g1~~TRINITY_DN4077_c0_g1_i3.p1  ORF type:complete len:211 (-),score=18.50 TRINITY_DN4077_c0_g1_i3:152-784(-)